jgi:predicted RNase H-like nuclease
LPPSARVQVVLGVDVGFSKEARSTALACLQWGRELVVLQVQRTRCQPRQVEAASRSLLKGRPATGIALDGPLRPALIVDTTTRRACDHVLALGAFAKRCRPAELTSPSGGWLHAAATAIAHCLAAYTLPRASTNPFAVPNQPANIFEAFPTAFLAVMLSQAQHEALARPHRRHTKLLQFYRAWLASTASRALLSLLFPRQPTLVTRLYAQLQALTNPHEAAAAVCSLTAALALTGQATALGEADSGYLVLPPAAFWQPWAREAIATSLARLRSRWPQLAALGLAG